MSEGQEVAEVRDVFLLGHSGSLPIRVYIPDAPVRCRSSSSFTVGWVLDNIKIADRPCRALVNAAGCIVASVG